MSEWCISGQRMNWTVENSTLALPDTYEQFRYTWLSIKLDSFITSVLWWHFACQLQAFIEEIGHKS